MHKPYDSRHIRAFLLLITLLVLALPFGKPVQAFTPMPPAIGPLPAQATQDLSQAKVQFYYFYSTTCTHCMTILNEVILPLQKANPGKIDVRLLDINIDPVAYQGLMSAEAYYKVAAEKRDIPTTLIDGKILIGEAENRAQLADLINSGLQGAPIVFPTVEGLDPTLLVNSPAAQATPSAEICSVDNPSGCLVAAPIHAAYFYQVGCKECSRAEIDLKHLQTLFPNLVITELNYYEDTALANWMAERVGRADEMHSPSVFIGDHAFIGEGEISVNNIAPYVQSLVQTGSPAFWNGYDPQAGQNALIERFKNMGWLAIVLAGLIDGLNPCAFATIVFFVSYLHLGKRKGREILITGAAFTLGVFLAYLVVGLGFYRVLDLIKNSISAAGKVVYALTGLFCLVLGILTLRDYFRVRNGGTEDMAMKLPEPLRKRINATIREGSKAGSYYIGAFVTGVLISLLELACTGQVYLPTIIYMTSVPALRGKALPALVLYNLMFIVPLIVVFVLAYYGTSSKDFSRFLKENAAPVKLAMAVLFIGLGIWLLSSLFA